MNRRDFFKSIVASGMGALGIAVGAPEEDFGPLHKYPEEIRLNLFHQGLEKIGFVHSATIRYPNPGSKALICDDDLFVCRTKGGPK